MSMYAKLKKDTCLKKNIEAYKVGFINKYDFNLKEKENNRHCQLSQDVFLGP